MKTLKLSTLTIITYLIIAISLFCIKNSRMPYIDSKTDMVSLFTLKKIKNVNFRFTPPDLIPVDHISFNHQLKYIAERNGLNESQVNVLLTISRDSIVNPVGPTNNLVSLGNTISKFSDALVDDALNNDGYVTPVQFEEIKTWRKVAKDLKQLK